MATMTAAVLRTHGGPDAVEVRDDVAVPTPGAGEVLVAVAAAGINNTDIWTREGAYGTPEDPDAVAGWKGVPIDVPRVQGGDAVGVVAASGPDVAAPLDGRRVLVDPITYGPRAADGEPTIEGVLGSEEDGAFAEYLCVPAERVHDVTDSPLRDVQLACLPIAYGTATGMLDRAGVDAGTRVLVTGASGGVGLALVQLAAARGAEVTGVTSSGHGDPVRSAGADQVVLRDAGDGLDGPLGAASRGGFDVVADVVGGPLLGTLLAALATGGRLVTCGAVAGPVVDVDLRVVDLQRRSIIGSTMHTPANFRQLVEDANAGRLDPPVARTFPLTDMHEAQREFTGDHVGKLVIIPGS